MKYYTARYNSAEQKKEWRARGRTTFDVGDGLPGSEPEPDPDPPGGEPLFAGHIPNRVLVGMAASNNQRPDFAEAMDIIGGATYERRIFKSTGITLNGLNDMLSDSDAYNAYPITSFKEAVGAISSGSANARLNIIRDRAKQRRTEGPGGTPMPFSIGNHHEPYNDNGMIPEVWALDQIYASNWLAGWTTDSGGNKVAYTAENDVSDIVAWTTIMNGHVWGPNNVRPEAIAAYYPQKLVDTIRDNGGILQVDTYEPNPPNGDRDNPGGYGIRADRTSKKIQAYIDWARSVNAGAIGFAEWNTVDQPEMEKCWKIARENRDIVAIFNYFNSFANSRWDWRLIPADYPAYNGTNSKGLVDEGGNIITEQKLNYFRTIRDESTSPQYTSPL